MSPLDKCRVTRIGLYLHVFLQILLPIELIQNSTFKVFFGSIQEDRHKVEQFYFLLKSSTFYGTVPQFVEQRLKNVEQLPKSETGPESGSQFKKLWKRGQNLVFLISVYCFFKHNTNA